LIVDSNYDNCVSYYNVKMKINSEAGQVEIIDLLSN
jgi:hypothetical protein